MGPSVVLRTTDCIQVRGARQHNLRNLDVDIPRDRLVVVTGLSGSGKSSLAYDTIFAEGQRRYIESLSAFARQFIEELERPDVDLVEGLPPTITVSQEAATVNPRSTVATVTELYDYLRLLYARAGTAHCWKCGRPVGRRSVDEIVEAALELEHGKRLMVLAPVIRGRKGLHRDVMARVLRDGFVRARVDGIVCDLNDPPQLDRNRVHTIEAVIDRLVVRDGLRQRLTESVRLALRHGDGTAILTHLDEDGWHDRVFSIRYACPDCELSFDELAPRNFSFNSPYGACPSCGGLGIGLELDPELVVPDKAVSIADGAIRPLRLLSPWRRAALMRHLSGFARRHAVRLDRPLRSWPARLRRQMLRGDGRFPGVLTVLERYLNDGDDEGLQQGLAAYLSQRPCHDCGGSRLRPEARSVTVAGRAIHQVTAMSVAEAARFFDQLHLPTHQAAVARPVQRGIRSRLRFLQRVGLSYLTLDRPAATLSGGEAQRIRLASHIGSGVLGVCYVLDEPTIGLHPRDNARLIAALKELRDTGNTVIVIEHDETMIRQADHLIDLGPGAGQHGGQLVAAGTVEQVCGHRDSLTAKYLRGDLHIPLPAKRRTPDWDHALTLRQVRTNNLKGIDVRLPLSTFITVTGVSGSGKSSLVTQTLAPALRRRLGSSSNGTLRPGPHAALEGADRVDKLIEIDRSPIGRTPRSNPATYVGLFDPIRRVFADTRDARLRGYKPGRFSPNVRGGRCEHCEGRGTRKIEMNFLPDMYLKCEACRGRRFNQQTLEIRYRGRTIADVLDMRVDEAAEFFEHFPKITRHLITLRDVGLGYITLGQPATTLSGGEAQRIKLAAELSRPATGRTMYILDEPTTGLHFADVENLLNVLNRLVDLGNTVIVIEHHLDVIKSSDYVVDLGPGAGDDGGHLVIAGAPEQVARCRRSHTGRFLRPLLRPASRSSA